MTIKLSVDMTVDSAYVTLSDVAIVRTAAVTDEVMVDLDEHGMVVGIEVLSLRAEIPFASLTADYHVHSDVIDLLHTIRPHVAGYLTLRQSADATSHAALSVFQVA